MKRILTLILTIIMIAQTVAVCAADNLELIINGSKPAYAVTAVKLGRGNYQMLAPASELSKDLSANCLWEESAKRITITKDSVVLILTTDSDIALVNGVETELLVPAQLISGVPYIPVEICGEKLNFHTLRERAGKRVRIISKTSSTAPAVSGPLKPGMAELVSEVHRPVPTKFTKSSRLDDLIYNKTDYSDAVKPLPIGERPTGELLFSQEDFLTAADVSHNGVEGEYCDYYAETQIIGEQDIADDLVSLSVKINGEHVGEVNNYSLPFNKALRIRILEQAWNFNDKRIVFDKRLPSPEWDDKYMLSYYARCVSGGDSDLETGSVRVLIEGPGVQTTSQTVTLTDKWQRFDFLCTGFAGATMVIFCPSEFVQTIDVGGFEIRDIGKDADISYFNVNKVDMLAEQLEPDAEWRKEALDRIEEVRKGDFKVVVRDKNGNPVPNANVKFDMFEHEFKFGVQMDGEYVEGTVGHGVHQKHFASHIDYNFNAMVVGNRHKWDAYLAEPELARTVMDLAKSKGIKYFRGHALWMPLNTAKGQPDELYALVDPDRYGDSSKAERYETFKDLIEEHFREYDEKFPEIHEWDVTNETHGRTYFSDVFGLQSVLTDVYKIATDVMTNKPERMLTDNRQFEAAYWDRLDDIRDWGIEYDSLGMQGHALIGGDDKTNEWNPTTLLGVWDRFAYEYHKTFAITEYSVYALLSEYGHEGMGDFTRDFYIAAFSHPACTGVTLWWLADYWAAYNKYYPGNPVNDRDGAGASPFYGLPWNAGQDFPVKPGLAQFHDLLYNKWWTRNATTTTNSNGEGSVRGFYGDYDVTVTVNGVQKKAVMAAFHRGYENVLTITLD